MTDNTEDFEQFMRNYQDMVYSTALRLLGNTVDAEDISQTAFLKAYQRFADLKESPTAGGWLKTVTTNLCLNHLTRYRARWKFFSEFFSREHDTEGDEIEFELVAPEVTATDTTERQELIADALQKLPDGQRVPLVLYHFDDLSYQEIAERLNISLPKVKTQIFRARQTLAKSLKWLVEPEPRQPDGWRRPSESGGSFPKQLTCFI